MSSKIYQGKDDVLIDNPGGLSVAKALKIPVSDESGAPPFSAFYTDKDGFVRVNKTNTALEFFLGGEWYDAGHGGQLFITTLKFFIGNGSPPENYTPKPASTTLQDNRLQGVQIVGWILLDNVPMEMDASGILFDTNVGKIDFASLGQLYDGQKLVMVVSGDNGTPPTPPPETTYTDRDDEFTGSTDNVLQLSYTRAAGKMVLVFYNGLPLVKANYLLGADTITLQGITRDVKDVILVFYTSED